MASTTSREVALERRRALTNGGKKVENRFMSTPGRTRTASDARVSRTQVTQEAVTPPASAAPRTVPPTRTRPEALATLGAPAGNGHQRALRPISNPSRELVLARREALSRKGKRADTSRDRTRTQAMRAAPRSAEPAANPSNTTAPAPSQRSAGSASAAHGRNGRVGSLPSLSSSLASRAGGSGTNGNNRPTAKRSAQHNPGRSLVLARREALSKRGKSAINPGTNTAATVARQGNPDISTRELAQKLRDLKSKVGSAGSCRNGGCRPTGPRRGHNRVQEAPDAHWKVGLSETSTGQLVTGTQANRSPKTTGNEPSTCRPITGTEYLGAEVFRTFCQSEPLDRQPAKVRVSSTSHGNRVTGNEVGRSEKVTGDEPGTCKNITGTEYIGADQATQWCGTVQPSPRKVGLTRTDQGRPVSGVMVGRSSKVTGDEPGALRSITGDQYVSQVNQEPGRVPTKVSQLHTLRGVGVTGTHVGRGENVTGDEPGSCRLITGDEYVGSQQYDRFCGGIPAPEPAKVGFTVTNRSQVVSGTLTGRSAKVTGDEPGTCKAVTGTPYAGIDEAGNWCSTNQVRQIRQRTPLRQGTPGPSMTGIQPGLGGVMTGAERGACEAISGTPYVGADHLAEACGAAEVGESDYPQPLESQPWQQFSVQSPARAAQVARQRSKAVTGNRYEEGNRITGPFDLAGDRVTGTEQFRFDREGRRRQRVPVPAAVTADEDNRPTRPTSRVTGEGISTGLRITGDDWDRSEHVTGTEGPSARRRNPTRPGPMSAMPGFQPKRNEEVPVPVSRVTGSSGNTDQGSLITVSGGARG